MDDIQPPTQPTVREIAARVRAGEMTPEESVRAALDRIAAQTRHSRTSTLVEHYIRPLEAMKVTSSRDLGL